MPEIVIFGGTTEGRREAERAARRYERVMDRASDVYRTPVYPPEKFPNIPGLGINEIELRGLLENEAKSRGAFDEAKTILGENVDELIERFHKLSDTEPEVLSRHPGMASRSGPSAETRKKLREKRKKNKK